MMIMRSRSSNSVRALGGALLALSALVFISIGVIFSGTVFRVASSLVVSFSLSPSREYQLMPKSVLASRLEDAERELSRIRYQSIFANALAEENKRLQNELGLREDGESGIGRVIGRPPRTHYDTLLVSLTDGHAVSVGDYAFFEGMLLGTASHVGENAALVELFSSPGKTTDVRIGTPEAIVVAQGLGGGAYIFDVPNDIAVAPGDTARSATHNARVVAIVQNIVVNHDRTTKRIYAHTVASFSDIQFVHFIHPSPFLEDEL